MAKEATLEAVEETISLYLDLEEGQTVDLEVVARASLAFSAAIKELAFVLDPSLEVQLGFASGTRGSLSLNSIVRSIRRKAADRTTLAAITLTVLGWFANDIRAYLVAESLNRALKKEEGLSDKDVERITAAVTKALQRRVAQKEVQQIYRELEVDTAVKGVGATLEAGKRPDDIVPRAQFDSRVDATVPTVLTAQKRIKKNKERVTLISPVLLDKNRRWRFYLPQIGEFSATIHDEKFLAGLLSGRRRIQMRAGIQLDVTLDTHEEKIGAVWVVKERRISLVARVRRAPLSADLFSGLPIKDEDDER